MKGAPTPSGGVWDTAAWRHSTLARQKLLLPGLTVLALVSGGCEGERRDTREAGEAPGCAEGSTTDLGECAPEACGSGKWGNLELDGDTIYVDIAAADGGNGSEEHPLTSIQAALNQAATNGGGSVAVAAGIYQETLTIGAHHTGIHLAGRCRQLVTLDASVGNEETAGIDIAMGHGDLTVSGLGLVGSNHNGVRVESGDVHLEGVAVAGCSDVGLAVAGPDDSAPAELTVLHSELESNTGVAVMARYSGTRVTLEDTTINATIAKESGDGGYGIQVSGGATLTAEGCDLFENTGLGIIIAEVGTQVSLRDTTIRGTLPHHSGLAGEGINIFGGATLLVEDCEIVDNRSVGVRINEPDTQVTLLDTIIRRTSQGELEQLGYGVMVYEGAELALVGCELAHNTMVAISAFDADTQVALSHTVVRNTLPDVNGDFGYGVQIHRGAVLEAQDCTLDDNSGAGVLAGDSATQAALLHTVVRGTQSSEDGDSGQGFSVGGGAVLVARSCELDRNVGIGVLATDEDTHVTLVDTAIRNTLPNGLGGSGYGIGVRGGAILTASSCVLDRNTLVGALAHDFGTVLSLEGTTIQHTLPDSNNEGGQGIQVNSRALLMAQGCAVVGNSTSGVEVFGPGTQATLQGAAIKDTLPDATGDQGFGAVVGKGAVFTAEACSLDGNTCAGVLATGAGTQASLRDSSITQTAKGNGHQGVIAVGIVAQEEAFLRATGVQVRANEGPGLYAASSSQLFCTDCSILENEFAGAVVVDEGTLELESSLISGTLQSPNLDGGVGIFAAQQWHFSPPRLIVVDSSISDNRMAGIHIVGEGSLEVTGTEITRSIPISHGSTNRCGDGIFAAGTSAWNGSGGLRLEGNVISDHQGSGLFLDDGHASLVGNSWSNNAMDLLIQGDACLTPRDEYAEVPTSDVCPTWDQPTCPLEFALNLVVAELPESTARMLRHTVPSAPALHVAPSSQLAPLSLVEAH